VTEPRPATGPSPVLVLGSGQRCGSTLVQRLLSSHPQVLIWGEQGGRLMEVLAASRMLRAWNEGVGDPAREAFAEGGHQAWIANLLPEPATVDDAARSYVETLLVAPAAAEGAPIWGFKEVRMGLEEAEWVRELFPDTRAVHVTRDPRDVLASLEWWERTDPSWLPEYTRMALDYWVTINESFVDATEALPWVESWRYEDILAESERFLIAVAGLVELDPSDLDPSVFTRRISSYTGDHREPSSFEDLPAKTRKLLKGDRLRAMASRYGYSL
jgi:Sulfotransferase family